MTERLQWRLQMKESEDDLPSVLTRVSEKRIMLKPASQDLAATKLGHPKLASRAYTEILFVSTIDS